MNINEVLAQVGKLYLETVELQGRIATLEKLLAVRNAEIESLKPQPSPEPVPPNPPATEKT